MSARCECGHTAHWHGQDAGRPSASGRCEHDGECRCPRFCEALSDRDYCQLVALLHECQSALTGPADLRQRIEDAVGPAPWRDALTGGDEVQDPSVDVANVNAAYVIERDDNARLRAALEKIAYPPDFLQSRSVLSTWAREALNGGDR